ncbi:hypothetical protein Tco_0890602 [Tanacetum coccineum]|uniref:Uncharacterized protein n=1 Tax=Tanacetum coccineum TaxID=301880 RepID=A0ABQ5C0J0_9ASTR
MLESGSYVPWSNRFMRYIDQKTETKKFLRHLIDKGPYQMKDIPAATTDTQDKRTQNEDDLTGDDLKHYEAYIEAMKFILISIPNDIYNSVDACQNARDMWNRVKRLIHEWYKYVTNVCLAKNLKKDIYDMLYDHLQQYESFINASRANTYASSLSFRSPAAYYVPHPPSVVDYDDDYKGDAVCDNQEDSLTTTIMLLARAITQRNSTPTNNRLSTSSNIKNQAVVPADKVNIQSRNVGNGGRFARRSSNIQEEFVESNNVQKETGNENVQRTLQTSLKDEAGVILSNEQNDFLLVDAPEMEELEEFSANTCMMARIQKEEIDSDFILSIETLPDVRSAYATISSEESHRVARSNQNLNFGPSRPSNVNNNRQGGGSGLNNNRLSGGSGLVYENYGFNGHTIDRCFKVIGYPAHFGKKKTGQNFKKQSVSSGFTDEK